MSNFEIQKTKVYEPRLDYDNGLKPFVIVKGSEQSTLNEYRSDSASVSQFVFNCKPPSKQTGLDRNIFVKCAYTLTFNGIADAYDNTLPLLQAGRDAPRIYPFSNTVESVNMKINGYSLSVAVKDMINPLTRYHTDMDYYNNITSLGPNQPDPAADYHQIDGANINPLAWYGDNVVQSPRGAARFNIIENTTTRAVVELYTSEPLFIPPCIFNGDQVNSLIGIENLQFQFQLSGLSGSAGGSGCRLWSRSYKNGMNAAGTAYTERITNIETTILGQPSMLCTFLSIPLTEKIPVLNQYSYSELVRYNTPNGAELYPFGHPSGANTATLTSNQISLNVIPSKMYIYVDRPDDKKSVYSTDTYLSIESLQVSFGNNNSVFADCPKESLFYMSQKNGLKMNWTEFNGFTNRYSNASQVTVGNGGDKLKIGTVGSVICIDSTDLPLKSNQAAGILSNINLLVKVTVRNTHKYMNIADIDLANRYAPQLNIVTVCNGVLEIYQNSCRSYLGCINQSDVVNVPVDRSINWDMLNKIYGGSQFDRFKNLTNKAIKVAKKGNEYLKQTKAVSAGLDMLGHPNAANFAKQYGYGVLEPVYGGKKVQKRDLKKRLGA